ncbi:DoxX family protein [Rubrivirga sp. IMCC43871]|uniref:DoxX family protein n=1 Tax=Rubrivirga sp. IMCC43871 TaxID=3391575 RepID=UPI003990107C
MTGLPDDLWRAASLVALAVLFVGAGVAHFVRPRMFEAIVPRWLPAWLPSARTLVVVSGVAEIAGGVGLLIPGLRAAAAWGLAALLVAVFPANVEMARDWPRFASLAPRWALVARLPLQAVLIAAVLWAAGVWG